MPWPTGLTSPNCDLLLEGAGVFFFDRHDADDNPTGYLDLGNAERLELTTDDTRIQKYSSRTKGRPLCKDSLQRRAVTLRTTLDEFSPDNLALMLQGSIAASAAQAATAVVGEALTPALNGVKLGGSYKTAKLGPITAVAVKKGATALVLNTPTVAGDYEVMNADLGIIHILTDPVTVGLVDGDDLTVDYTPTAYATGVTQISGGTEGKVSGSGLYVSDNTEGPNFMIEFWKLTAKPDGAIGFISDDFGTMGLQFAVEDDTAHHPTAPLYRVTYR